jgi:hypothetical protein
MAGGDRSDDERRGGQSGQDRLPSVVRVQRQPFRVDVGAQGRNGLPRYGLDPAGRKAADEAV